MRNQLFRETDREDKLASLFKEHIEIGKFYLADLTESAQ